MLEISSAEQRLSKYENYFSQNTPRLRELTRQVKKYDSNDIDDRIKKLKVARNEKTIVNSELDKLKIIIKNKLDKLKEIGQFDPNCEFCRKRESEFIQATEETKISLDKDKVSVSGLLERQSKVDTLITILEPAETESVELKTIIDEYKWLNTSTGIIEFKNLILIIPGTSKSGKYKQWPAKNFIDLCIRLENDGSKICIVGTKNDKKIISNIVENCNSALDFTEKSPPEIIFSIAKKCQLVVTNDTGPGHIAALSKNKILWLAINNLITKINIENNKFNQKIVAHKIEKIAVGEVYNKIKEML